MAGRKFRAAGFGGVAVLGAGVLLSACAPAQMGAAAILGNQRISQSTLASNVSSLQADVAKVPAGQVQLPASEMSQAVLSWLVRFKIEDQAAEKAGISLTAAQVQQGLATVEMTAEQDASRAGLHNPMVVLLSNGISGKMLPQLARYQAQELELAKQANGGKLPSPTSQKENAAVQAALTKSSCQAAKSLNIQVNPQYGRLDYQQFTVVAGPNVLSKAVGASPAPATGASPAC